MGFRPSRGFQQFFIRRGHHVEVVGMIATALIDSRIQFEIYLIEAVDEANPKFLPVDFPDQAASQFLPATRAGTGLHRRCWVRC